MTETIILELFKSAPAFAVLAFFAYNSTNRNREKDERIKEMHNEVVSLVKEVKNEMTETFKTSHKEMLEVIVNNTIAMNEMKNVIEKTAGK